MRTDRTFTSALGTTANAARQSNSCARQFPGVEGWNEIQGDPNMWHVRFMQVPGLAEKLVIGRQADYFGCFFHFGKFTPSEVEHFVNAYASEAQLDAVFEMYRAFPVNAQCFRTVSNQSFADAVFGAILEAAF